MKKIQVSIGQFDRARNGTEIDNTRSVEFDGEQVAHVKRPDKCGTRGTTYTLYRSADDRLLVHTYQWSNWQGEADIYALHAVNESDLGPTGNFWLLGEEAGFGRPLTLDEALAEERYEDHA